MSNIITDLDVLRQGAAEPLQFISEQGIEKEEGLAIIAQLCQAMEANPEYLALSAPQIGSNKRIICIRFDDGLKIFIDPVIIKKANYSLAAETFPSLPGKEILISRPEELTVVYYTADFKYEENKLLGIAARLFDQQVQLLDGILPDVLGLVSDPIEDGPLSALTEDEFMELAAIYKKFVQIKAEAVVGAITEDENLVESYKKLQFSEKVIHGEALVIAENPTKGASNGEALVVKKLDEIEKAQNKLRLSSFLKRKGKA